jgi:glycosyltransferase involved in cell wall biosynthesis
VYHLHNKGVSLHQDKRFNRMCYCFVFKGADVILLSKYLYADIQEFVPEERVYICPNGIADIQPETRNPKPETSIVRILFLSNLIKSKGVFVLLDAMALLAKKGILFEGVFIGGEGDVTANQFNVRVGQLELDDRVSYQGKKYGEEKNNAFSEVDIFAFPTYYETFGLVNLEAMSYSLPVVSTFEGGIPDVVEDGVTGFLVPQQNIEALAEKLEVLIKDSALRQQMGTAGREKYEQGFTLERFEAKMVEILKTVVEKK